ncbi:MAG: CsbD family protein [Oxalobacteraceae bacterium]|nr:MAG: CsbD family protein [Oxalobacteraceae bacterium]
MTSIISKIAGTINTAVGKIKQNADGHSFDKEGAEQEELGKSQLNDSSEKNNIEKDG